MIQNRRDEALDCAKGIAMLAVVLFHITRGFVAAGQLPDTIGLRFADRLAYGFHVQLFFIIAGYLAFPRADQPRYQLQRQTSLYYAYLFWSLASWLLAAVFAGQMNRTLGWEQLAWLPVIPIQHFWFILVLMAGTALLAFLRTSGQLILGILLSLALASTTVMHSVSLLSAVAGLYPSALPFILLGGWIRQRDLRLTVNPWLGALGFALLAASAWMAVTSNVGWGMPQAFPVMLAGCYGAYVAGAYAARVKSLCWLFDTLGRHSLAIFLVHIIAGAGVRILLAALAPQLPVVIPLVLSLAAALLLPILLERTARRIGLAALLGFDPLPFGRPARSAIAT